MKFKLVSDEKRRIYLNMDAINTYVARYKANTPFEFEITRRVKTKSDPMRKYYFGQVITPFAEEVGYEKNEILMFHEQLKARYFEYYYKLLDKLGLPHVEKDKYGIYRNVPHVFADESPIPVNEKAKFLEWVIRVAARDGVYIETANS